jgi:hypothetical protein
MYPLAHQTRKQSVRELLLFSPSSGRLPRVDRPCDLSPAIFGTAWPDGYASSFNATSGPAIMLSTVFPQSNTLIGWQALESLGIN